jgi:hypothetical protein
MDKARWIVVFSVAFFMILTLSLLQQMNVSKEEKQTGKRINKQADQGLPDQVNVFKSDNIKIHGKKIDIKYSRRPSHLFAPDKPAEFEREDIEFRDKGKILE